MPERAGDLAIVLHSHMPYVEGFGTYPFGEEWLFEAVARSYLPLLEIVDGVTMTVTPVLADQLEADGVGGRMLDFLRRHRLETAERDAGEASGALAAAAEGEASAYRRAIERLEDLGGDVLAAFQGAAEAGRIAPIASAATHAVLPMLATRAGKRLQIDAGLRSHRRRFGESHGFWLPECAFRPGLDGLLAEREIAFTCLYQSPVEGGLDALAPARTAAGPVAFTLDWPAIELVWSGRGYPSGESYLEYHRQSVNGTRLWSIGGRSHDPGAATEAARRDAADFLGRVAARLRDFRADRGRDGLVTFAIDTELLGHWWAEGPQWLGAVLEGARDHGVRVVTLPEALAAHESVERPLRESSWGESKDLSTWDSPAVSDLAWGARRLELRLLAALGRGLERGAAERAARELLAVQASDWAFLDGRGGAGDYPYRRAVTHAQGVLEAIDSPSSSPESRMRNLAPDLSLAPLLEP